MAFCSASSRRYSLVDVGCSDGPPSKEWLDEDDVEDDENEDVDEVEDWTDGDEVVSEDGSLVGECEEGSSVGGVSRVE